MKSLISHLLRSNRENILSNSFLNCHAIGLHSILLLDSPDGMIRMFVADENHELYKNDNINTLSLGFHANRQDISLSVWCGSIVNWVIRESNMGLPIDKYEYKSPILNTEGGFVLIGKTNISTISKKTYGRCKSVFMDAADIHTVFVPEGKFSAWFVFEGKKDSGYEPITFSNADLCSPKINDGLYIKPAMADIYHLLTKCKLM